MTPVIVVLFVLALCTTYVYIAMQASTYVYVGDYKFVMFKVMMVVSIIAMGYLTTMLSYSYKNLPFIGEKLAEAVLNMMEDHEGKHRIARTFLEYLSGIWFVFAVALLPFGHTVHVAGTQQIDVDRTSQLLMMHQTIYSGPYFLMMLAFSLHLFLFFFAIGNYNERLSGERGDDTDFSHLPTPLTDVMKIVPTCGWFFYVRDYRNDLEGA